jgi:hypothetical protein
VTDIKASRYIIRIGTYEAHQELQVAGLAAAMNVGRALYQINQGSVIIVNIDGYPKIITLKGTKRWTPKPQTR